MFKTITQKKYIQLTELLASCIHEKAEEHNMCNQRHEDPEEKMMVAD